MKPPPVSEATKELTTLQNLEKLISEGKLIESNKYFCISYCPPEKLTSTLGKCTFWAYIFHDKDDKEPHYHYFLQFNKNKNILALAKEFYCDEFTFMCENVRDKTKCLRYLVHADNGDKYQYPLSDVESSAITQVERANRLQVDATENNEQLMRDLFTLDVFQLGAKYGRDFIKNTRHYAEFVRFASCIYQPLNEDTELSINPHSFANMVIKGI